MSFLTQHDNFQNGLSLWLLRVGRASAAQLRRIFSSRIHFWMFQKRWIISGIDSGESRSPTYSKTFSKSSCKSMKINRKSMKFNENQWNSMKINENWHISQLCSGVVMTFTYWSRSIECPNTRKSIGNGFLVTKYVGAVLRKPYQLAIAAEIDHSENCHAV